MFIDILTQAIGIGAMIFSVLSFQGKASKNILALQFCASTLWLTHFFMLGAFLGFIFNIVALSRLVVFYFKEKAWARHIFWFYFFVGVIILTGILTWEGPISLLAIFGMIASNISFYMKNPNRLRILYLFSSPLWLTYDSIVHSLGGVLTEIFCICSIIIALIRSKKINNAKKVA